MSRERKNNLFKEVPIRKPKRAMFDLSHEVKMSGKFGYLYPVLLMDCVPGDTVRDQSSVFVRLAPMLAPVMHRLDVTMHFFFVPNRIICDEWEKFITGGQDGLSEVVLPYVTPDGIDEAGAGDTAFRKGELWDYLGLPVLEGAAPTNYNVEKISVLPFRACAKVWNDYYRDPTLDEEMDLRTELMGDVSQETVDSSIMFLFKYRHMWEKDYFTSALPWPQRGAQVLMPLAGVANAGDIDYFEQSYVRDATGTAPAGAAPLSGQPDGGSGDPNLFMNPGSLEAARIENIESIQFDNASTTINDFRRALAIQRWLENNARGGARYIEQIEGHFDVRVPDYRLQRAEYLGGGRQPVQISEVLATAEGSEVPVGDMAGHGLSVGSTNQFTYRCQEHGWIVGFMTVTMRSAYSQGIPRMWSRQNKFDFAWPELAHLGEQEIHNKEVFFDYQLSGDAANQATFGYIPRYAEYKFMSDRVAGDFRDSLSFWQLGRKFLIRPSLVSQFTTIYEDGNVGNEESYRRIFAVQDGTDYVWCQIFHRLSARRPLPYFGVPSIV